MAVDGNDQNFSCLLPLYLIVFVTCADWTRWENSWRRRGLHAFDTQQAGGRYLKCLVLFPDVRDSPAWEWHPSLGMAGVTFDDMVQKQP